MLTTTASRTTTAKRIQSSVATGVLLWLAVSQITGASAQADKLTARVLLAAPNTSSPRATLESFSSACGEIYDLLQREHEGEIKRDLQLHDSIAERILRCLDTSEIPEFRRKQVAAEAAVCIKEVLDRVEVPPSNEIPGSEEIAAAVKSGDPITRWLIPGTEITIRQADPGAREGEFLFSPDTVGRAPEFYRRVGHLPYKPGSTAGLYRWFLSEPGPAITWLVKLLPEGLRTGGDGRHAPWQWAGLILTLALTFTVMIGAYLIGRRWAQRFRQDHVVGFCLTLVFPIVAMLTPAVSSGFIEEQLRISGTTMAVTSLTLNLIFLFAAMVVVLGIGGRVAAIVLANPRIHPKGLDAQFVRIICRLLSIVGAVVIFLEGGRFLGIPLTTLFASAGVGGVALALAAQDSLKNLFGSMMIMLDKPFRINERIVVKGYDGIVEEIGLRSTKLRLLTGHQTSIPNDEIARGDIENVGRRRHIRRLADLRLPLDTSRAKLERAVAIVREILDGHEGYEEEFPPRAFLAEINADAFILRMVYWFHPPDYWRFLAHAEEVNLQIKEAFEREGIAFAPPTSRTLVEREGGEKAELPSAAGTGETDP